MGKRLALLGTTIALVALAVGVVSPAWGSSGGNDKQTTFRLLAVITELKFQGTALGDQIVFTNKLLRGDTEVGHEGAVCTVTSAARQEIQCVATFSLRGGQITAQALVQLGTLTPYLVAITGGSGKFEGADGQIEVRPVSQDSGVHIFHLRD